MSARLVEKVIRRKSVPIYPPHKRIRRQKSHGSCQQPVHCARQEAIAKEQEAGYESVDIKLGVVEDDAVQEDPEGTAAADKDGLPPPMVILIAVNSAEMWKGNGKRANLLT